MSVAPARADAARAFRAPDGIAILPFDLPGMAHLSFVEGRIPPRPEPYPVHLHGALEQVTYVLAGEIEVTTWDAQRHTVATFIARTGDAFVTLPLQTLAFANHGAVEARVLFVCAPAYPADDRDTRLVEAHRPPNDDERAWSRARHRTTHEAFAAIAATRGQKAERSG